MVLKKLIIFVCLISVSSSYTHNDNDRLTSSEDVVDHFSSPYGDRQDAELVSTIIDNPWPAFLTAAGFVAVTYAAVHFVQNHFAKKSTPPAQYDVAYSSQS